MFIVPRTEPQPASTRPQVTWEESVCPQCTGRHWTPLIEAQDHRDGDDGLWFAIVQCDSCGTCFTNPRPDPASIESFHGDNSSSQQKHHQPRTTSRWNVFRWLNRPRVEKPSIAWHGQGRLLDVACEAGDYLRMMHRRGWTVAGIDSSTQHVEQIRTELGLTVFLGMLPHSELEPESFDVITMWHLLERVHDPVLLLREAHRLLAPGGKLVLAVPNIDSLPFRWFGRHWSGLDLPRTLTHFTPTSLQQLLQRCGFTRTPIHGVRHADWLRESAKWACRNSTPPRGMRWLKYRIPAMATAWWCDFMGQTDCMIATAYR